MLSLPTDWKELLRQAEKEPIVEALAAIHASQVQRKLQEGRDPDEEVTYERVRLLLQKREERLGRERRMVDDLLGQVRRELGPPAAPSTGPIRQQEIVLCGERGQAAGGRFRLSNAAERIATFTFRAGLREDGSPTPPLSFQPDPITIGPGASAPVQVRVDLQSESRPGHLTIPVDVVAARLLSQRLWIVVQVS